MWVRLPPSSLRPIHMKSIKAECIGRCTTFIEFSRRSLFTEGDKMRVNPRCTEAEGGKDGASVDVHGATP